jgi:hypothetical protein
MNVASQTIQLNPTEFADIPASARLAILLPTYRWSDHVRSTVGSLLGVANEEVVVLIGDNSENKEKRDFLKKIHAINPFILTTSHKQNIGSFKNYMYLHDWCRDVEFSAILTDDDWISPTYHTDAYRHVLANPSVSCCSAGTTFVDIGDGQAVNVNQPSMLGAHAIDRMKAWSAGAARATMYNASRRQHLSPAMEFHRRSPLNGLTLIEDLWELSRLAQGEFHNISGQGIYLHYPATRTIGGDETERFYNLICKNEGLQFPFVYFAALSTAIQCAVFLMGKLSPVNAMENRYECAQHVFRHIFLTQFLPHVTGSSSQDAAAVMFAEHPAAMAGFLKYCNTAHAAHVVCDKELLNWFVEVIRVFESPATEDKPLLSQRFEQFVHELLQ